MSEAKLQDGSTVKGYRTLTDGDIERMNRLKGVSRHFCKLLDTERENVSAELSETVNHSVEAQEASRCLTIIYTKMYRACMLAFGSVVHPDASCLSIQKTDFSFS